VEPAPIELVLLVLVLAPVLVEPVVRLVDPPGDDVVELDGVLLEEPLPCDALVSMYEVMPVAFAPVRAVRDVPLVELVDEDAAPVVPVTPA
jgi:hypothetical protein